MEIIKKIMKRILIFFINLLILPISLIIPKSNKIVIIGGWFGKRFADNSKYLYLYLNDNLNNLGFNKVIWITRNKKIKNELNKQGYRAYCTWSILSIWYHFRAKYHFIDQSVEDINGFFSIRSKRINMWHGFPLKKIGNYMKYKNRSISILENIMRKWTTRGFWYDQYILATSNLSAEILGKAFGIDKSKVIISGYPRNYDTVYGMNAIKYISCEEKNFFDAIINFKEQGYKIVGYLPTFRDKNKTLFFGTEDINKLNNFLNLCEQHKIKVIGKFHFASKNHKCKVIENHEAFVKLPSEADVYTFLSKIDILITDYSSIYFDYLLQGGPIIFFPYDLEYYREKDRGLIFDYDEFTPGPKVYNIEELESLLLSDIRSFMMKYENEYRVKADELKTMIFGDYKNMGIEHLINQIRN